MVTHLHKKMCVLYNQSIGCKLSRIDLDSKVCWNWLNVDYLLWTQDVLICIVHQFALEGNKLKDHFNNCQSTTFNQASLDSVFGQNFGKFFLRQQKKSTKFLQVSEVRVTILDQATSRWRSILNPWFRMRKFRGSIKILN